MTELEHGSPVSCIAVPVGRQGLPPGSTLFLMQQVGGPGNSHFY